MVESKLRGDEIEELQDLASAHFWPHARQIGDMFGDMGIRLVASAEGSWIVDAEGERWFDTLAGMWLKNIGHGRREIADAVYRQMLDVSYTPGGTVSPATVNLAAKVASLAPDKESRVFFVSGGSEAVETALKMAKQYHNNRGEPGRWKVISRRGSYHGATHGCISLGGGGAPPPGNAFGPLVPGNIHVAQPNEYRCTFCRDKGGCNLECAQDVGRAIEHEGPASVAAFIGEPISAAAGIHVPHPEYWPTIREICDKHGVLMICDEVITGFGRTGRMFATEHWDVTPDIFTVAKAMTSGYLPIGGTIATKKVADAFASDADSTFRHLITFGGNPACCAAGLANLEIMENEGMVENSARMGDYLFESLQTLYEYPIVGDVRGGKGLICGVELVKNRDTKEKFAPEDKLAEKLTPIVARHGLLGRFGDIVPIAPPLCVTKDEIDFLVKAIGDSIAELQTTM